MSCAFRPPPVFRDGAGRQSLLDELLVVAEPAPAEGHRLDDLGRRLAHQADAATRRSEVQGAQQRAWVTACWSLRMANVASTSHALIVAVTATQATSPLSTGATSATGFTVVLLPHGFGRVHGQGVSRHPGDPCGYHHGDVGQVVLTAQQAHPVVLTQLVGGDLDRYVRVELLDRRLPVPHDQPPAGRVVGRLGEGHIGRHGLGRAGQQRVDVDALTVQGRAVERCRSAIEDRLRRVRQSPGQRDVAGGVGVGASPFPLPQAARPLLVAFLVIGERRNPKLLARLHFERD